MDDSIDFIVNRADLQQTAFVRGRESASASLPAGQVLVRVGRFAFTANNITYGAIGETVGYWSFFPAREGWGRIPLWGFAEGVHSRHASLPVGEPASRATVTPTLKRSIGVRWKARPPRCWVTWRPS